MKGQPNQNYRMTIADLDGNEDVSALGTLRSCLTYIENHSRFLAVGMDSYHKVWRELARTGGAYYAAHPGYSGPVVVTIVLASLLPAKVEQSYYEDEPTVYAGLMAQGYIESKYPTSGTRHTCQSCGQAYTISFDDLNHNSFYCPNCRSKFAPVQNLSDEPSYLVDKLPPYAGLQFSPEDLSRELSDELTAAAPVVDELPHLVESTTAAESITPLVPERKKTVKPRAVLAPGLSLTGAYLLKGVERAGLSLTGAYVLKGVERVGSVYHLGGKVWNLYLHPGEGVAGFGGPTRVAAANELYRLWCLKK